MRLSVRLLALGVSGPLVGLVLFLGVSIGTVIQLSRKANIEITNLFDQDNRSKLMLTTSMIQNQAKKLAQRLQVNSERLSMQLDSKLSLSNNGSMTWEGRRVSVTEVPSLLNPILARPITDATERSSVYYRDSTGLWRRLAGVNGNGHALAAGEVPPISMQKDISNLMERHHGRRTASNSMLRGNTGTWRMTRLTPLEQNKGSGNLILAVSVRTDAANAILDTSAALIPYKSRQAAFFGFSSSGKLYCSYATPEAGTCTTLERLMRTSGGVPHPGMSKHEILSERTLTLPKRPGQPAKPQRMFLATFPDWNWLAVILVEESKLDATLIPLQDATTGMLMMLTMSSLLLIAGCAIAAWKIEKGIEHDLNKLAAAADDIAAGRSRTKLIYGAIDPLGRLVHAFNRMSGAVADREASLRERIRTLEIDINEQALTGQVCSITQDPSFEALNRRAREMRARRNQRQQDPFNSALPDDSAS